MQQVPFYDRIIEDRTAACLIKQQKIDHQGFVRPVSKAFDEKVFVLDSDSCKAIATIFNADIQVLGRSRTMPLNISWSMQELASRLNEYAVANFNKNIAVLFDGSAIWKPIKSSIKAIFQEWCKELPSHLSCEDIITPTFRAFLAAKAHDYDWQWQGLTANRGKALINSVMIPLMADKFKAQEPSKKILVKELEKLRIHSLQEPPKCYLRELFVSYSTVTEDMPDLHALFIKAQGFASAIDINEKKPQLKFSLRKVRDADGITHDYFFPGVTKPTIRAVNSLYIDVTKLLGNHELYKLTINSFMGLEARLQAFSDRNLSIFTYNAHKPADRLDFIKTAFAYSFGGRCYQKGWHDKIIEALIQDVNRKEQPLADCLAAQLISRAKAQKIVTPAALIAVTFNVSVLLTYEHPSYIIDIQRLWRLILSHIDVIEEAKSQQETTPFLEMIHMLMRDPAFNFMNLYAQIQISSYIEQNHLNSSMCYPTQTEEKLFTQIRLFQGHKNSALPEPPLTLLFPYNLKGAIEHFFLQRTFPVSLIHLHKSMINTKELNFGFNQSSLSKYVRDPRRMFLLCVEAALPLLERKDENLWSVGFLLLIAHMSMQACPKTIEQIFSSFCAMIKDTWPTEQFKLEMGNVFCRLLHNSGVESDVEFLINCKPKEVEQKLLLIKILYAINSVECLKEVFMFLSEIEDELQYIELIRLYYALIKSSKRHLERSAVKDGQCKSFDMLFVNVNKSKKISQEDKLKLYIALINISGGIYSTGQQEILWNNWFNVLECMPNLSDKFICKHRSIVTDIAFKALKLWLGTHKAPVLMRHFFRLNILADSHIDLLWEAVIRDLPEEKEAAFPYLLSCIIIATETQYWAKLSAISRATFAIKLINLLADLKFNQSYILDLTEMQVHSALVPHLAEHLYKLLPVRHDAEYIKSPNKYVEDKIVLLQRLFVGPVPLDKIDCFFSTLKMLTTCILKPSHISELTILIRKITHICRQEAALNVINTYFMHIDGLHKALYLELLDQIYQLLMTAPKDFSDLIYNQFLDRALNFHLELASLKKNPRALIKILHRRHMHRPLINVYMQLYKNAIDVPLEILKCALNAVVNLMFNDRELITSAEISSIIRGQINISKVDGLLAKNLVKVCRFLSQRCLYEGAYLEAKEWLIKEISLESLRGEMSLTYAINLVLTLINKTFYKDADELIVLIDIENNERLWLQVCDALVSQGQIVNCLNIFNKKNFYASMHAHVHKKLIQRILKKLLQAAMVRADTNFVKSIYTVLHFYLWSSNLVESKSLWKLYFEQLFISAPLDLAEEALKNLKNLSAIFNLDEKYSIAVKLIQGLIRRESHILSVDDTMWYNLQHEFINLDIIKQQKLFYLLLKAASLSLKQVKFSYVRERMIHKLINIIKVNERAQNFLASNVHQFFYRNDIYLQSNDPEIASEGLLCMPLALHMRTSNQKLKEKVAASVAYYLNRREWNEKLERHPSGLFACIKEIQESPYHTNAFNFAVLRYFSNLSGIAIGEPRQVVLMKVLGAYSQTQAVRGILTKDGSGVDLVSDEQKRLLQNTLRHFRMFPLECCRITFEWSLKQQNLITFVDRRFYDQVMLMRVRSRTPSLMRKVVGFIDRPCKEIYRGIRRAELMHAKGIISQYQLSNLEISMLKQLFTIAVVCMVAGGVLNIICRRF